MKKLLLGLIIFFVSFTVMSQKKLYILTENTTECFINVETGDIFNCNETVKKPGTFIIDDEYSEKVGKNVFIHIVPSISSVYDVVSYRSEESILIVENISDVGNNYIHHFDFSNNYITILFMNPDALIDNKYRKILMIKISQTHTID
ncbi:MAG: hypothetical protein ACOC3V_04450 [bacterium]